MAVATDEQHNKSETAVASSLLFSFQSEMCGNSSDQ